MTERGLPGTGRLGPFRLSTARALSLVTAVVVFTALSATTILVFVTLRRSALASAQETIERAVAQLATVSATSIQQGSIPYARAAHDPAILAALTGDRAANSAAVSRLKSLRPSTDST